MSAGGIQKKGVSAGFLLGTSCLTARWGSPCARHRNHNYNIFCQTKTLYQQHILSDVDIISTIYILSDIDIISTTYLYQQNILSDLYIISPTYYVRNHNNIFYPFQPLVRHRNYNTCVLVHFVKSAFLYSKNPFSTLFSANIQHSCPILFCICPTELPAGLAFRFSFQK